MTNNTTLQDIEVNYESVEPMDKIYFKDANDFKKYLIDKKPSEIWLDDYSPETPYIARAKYEEEFRAVYTEGVILIQSLDKLFNIYEEGMYVLIVEPKEDKNEPVQNS